MAIKTIQWTNNHVKLIDQTELPNTFKYIHCRDIKSLWGAIKRLSVRGAPAIGVAAGFGVLLGIKGFKGADRVKFVRHVEKVCRYMGSSRPTAVNLFNALERMQGVLKANPCVGVVQLKQLLKKEAMAIYDEDRRVNRQMAEFGSSLIKSRSQIMTVCNAGALATVDYGTALGVMYRAKEKGRQFKVYACETRPLLQGARLTTWELMRQKIDTTLICDNMAATLMQSGSVDAIFTGADRVAANGDAANKIGTYNLAVLAKHHRVPFYIVAPLSTFDQKIKSGKKIPIEQRSPDEIRNFSNRPTAPNKVKVYNPAFDVTDHKLITGIVTEYGIVYPPFTLNLKRIFKKYGQK